MGIFINPVVIYGLSTVMQSRDNNSLVALQTRPMILGLLSRKTKRADELKEEIELDNLADQSLKSSQQPDLLYPSK